MFVEDFVVAVRDRLADDIMGCCDFSVSEWHHSFISNVAAYVSDGNPLSTNQSKTILKFAADRRRWLVAEKIISEAEISDMLRAPQHRRSLYQSTAIPREVRHLGSNMLGFRFKHNDLIIARIKRFGEPARTEWLVSDYPFRDIELIERPRFDWTLRIWIVAVFRHNVSGILHLIDEYRFRLDQPTSKYLRLAQQSFGKSSFFARQDDVILGTVCDNPFLAGWLTEVADGVVL